LRHQLVTNVVERSFMRISTVRILVVAALAFSATVVSGQYDPNGAWLVWNATVANNYATQFDNSGVVFAEGFVCFNSRTQATCLDEYTGQVYWSMALGAIASYDTYPAHRNGTLVVLGASVMAFNVFSGAMLWNTTLSSPPSFWSASIDDQNQEVYVAVETGVVALCFVTGEVRWQGILPFSMQNRTVGPPAFRYNDSTQETHVLVNGFGNIVKFTSGVLTSIATGPGPGDAWNEPLYVCSQIVATWQTLNESEVWTRSLEDPWFLQLSGYPYAGSVINPAVPCSFVVLDGSGVLQTLTAEDQQQWVAFLPERMQYWAQPESAANGSIFVVASTTHLAVVNASSGVIMGTAAFNPTLPYVERRAAVNANGSVVFVGVAGQVLAYQLPTLPPPPTAGPTPAPLPPWTGAPWTPAPTSGFIEMEWCDDGTCGSCQPSINIISGCVPLNGSMGSINRTCFPDFEYVQVAQYPNTQDCTGYNITTTYYFSNCNTDTTSGFGFQYLSCS
jgi:hypothetical protein